MTEKRAFYRKLLALVIPIAFQNFMTAAVSASDALMLGMVSQENLSAVSLAGQIPFVLSLFLAALTIGTTILAAQYWGKGDREAVEKIFAIAVKSSAGISLVFFLATVFFPLGLMRIFTKDEVLIEKGGEYLRIVGISYILMGISQMYLCIMKNSGRTAKSTLIGSSSMVLNIMLNGILIFGLGGIPPLGIKGAALATVLARMIELLWAVGESCRRGRIHVKFAHLLREERELRKDFWKYTWPVLGNELVWGCGFTMYSVIMGHLGSDAVAANSMGNILKNLIACLCLGIGSGGGILVGNELGRGELGRAKRFGDRLFWLSAVSGLVSGLILLALSPLILDFGNLSPEASGYLKGMLVMCSYYLVGKSINSTVIAGIFCAGGDSRFGLLCDSVTMWAFTVPLGALAAFWLKLPVLAVYFLLNLDEIVKLPAVYRHYKKYSWLKDLTRKQN